MQRSVEAGASIMAAGSIARAGGFLGGAATVHASPGRTPNFIIIYCDDLGYGDLGCYGSRAIRTPAIDQMANEGVRFTDYYSCNGICAPSRAGLLTGRYPYRSGIIGNVYPENEPITRRWTRNIAMSIMGDLAAIDVREQDVAAGIPERELLLPEALKTAGYRTGMVGKWHLGDYSIDPAFNPVNNGFDSFLGVPHSNDMSPFPLYHNEDVVEKDLFGKDQSMLTGLYTEEARRFVRESADSGSPFFLYFAHTFPHQPLWASEDFAGRSEAGKFGDAVEEIDSSVAQIFETLAQAGSDHNTLVIFTSDNGPWYEGNPGRFRGRKGQSYEGGFRVPMIARWPGRIEAGRVCSEPMMNIDFHPTFLGLAGVEEPDDRIIDGRNILGLLTERESKSPHEALFFYHFDRLEGVRAGKWKYLRRMNRYTWPAPLDTPNLINRMDGGYLGERWPLLYNLELDPGESYNVIDRHPEVVEELETIMAREEQAREENPGGWMTV